MFFQTHIYKIDTHLSLSDVRNKLASIIDESHVKAMEKLSFEGFIKDDNFEILPTFNYSNSNPIRPIIKGELCVDQRSSKIVLTLTFKLHPFQNFLVTVLAPLAVIFIFIQEQIKDGGWVLSFLSFFALTVLWVLVTCSLGQKIIRSKEILKHQISGRDVSK